MYNNNLCKNPKIKKKKNKPGKLISEVSNVIGYKVKIPKLIVSLHTNIK